MNIFIRYDYPNQLSVFGTKKYNVHNHKILLQPTTKPAIQKNQNKMEGENRFYLTIYCCFQPISEKSTSHNRGAESSRDPFFHIDSGTGLVILRFLWVNWNTRIASSLLFSLDMANSGGVNQRARPSRNVAFLVYKSRTEWNIRRIKVGIHVMSRTQWEAKRTILVWRRELFTFALCICMC